MKRSLLTLVALLCLPLMSLSQQTAPIISLLTCGPTDEYVFYLYGHTALRVQTTDGQDLVYNYGYFSPDQKNFVLNFAIGKPMYSVGVTTMQDFLQEYGAQGRYVVEQVLNLKPTEATAMLEKLQWNALPENRNYKYNFYFDNCATRPRDFIEEFSGGIIYNIDAEQLPTFREAIRSKSYYAAWYTAAADLCLGWQTDQQMSLSDAAFLPELLMQEMESATRAKDGEKLVLATHEHLPQVVVVGEKFGHPNMPFWVFVGIAVLYALFYYIRMTSEKGKPLEVLRSVLYLFLAIGGIIIWFLALASEHPHTFPNANMLLFHPFYLLILLSSWRRKHRAQFVWLYLINFVAIIVHLALGYMQVYPLPITILALIMLLDMWIQWREVRKVQKATTNK